MKLSRSRIIITLFVSIFTLTLAGQASPQGDPQVAKNVGEPATVIPVDVSAASTTTLRPTAPRPGTMGNLSPTDVSRVGVQTAQPLPISLNDVIRRVLENNNDVEVSRDDVRFQETQVRSFLGAYDPVFSISPNYTRNSSTGAAATNDFRVNTSFTKLLKEGGGNYQVFFNNNRTENQFNQSQVTSGLATTNGAIYSSSLGFSYVQPLFRNFKIDNTRRIITIARKQLQQSDADFQSTLTSRITLVQSAYWDFVFALRNQQNQVANVNFAKENLRQIEAKIDAGSAAPLERAEVATELANREGDLLLATQQVSVSENALKQLVLKDPLSAEWSQTFVPTDKPAFSVDPLSLDVALKDAIDNRFDLRRLKLQKEINETDIKYFKNQTKPQIDLNSNFSLQGLASSGPNTNITTNLLTSAQDLFLLNGINNTRTSLLLPPLVNPPVFIPAQPGFLFGGFNRSLANIFRSDAPNFSIGMTISFPFRNRTAKANLDGARIQEHQLDAQARGLEQTVIVEVRNAVQAVETTRQRVLTARRARESAEVQLDGERKLYESGRSTTFLLFQRENSLTNARNAEIRAETDHNKALADLQRVTATAFRVNNIQVVPPVTMPK